MDGDRFKTCQDTPRETWLRDLVEGVRSYEVERVSKAGRTQETLRTQIDSSMQNEISGAQKVAHLARLRYTSTGSMDLDQVLLKIPRPLY